MTKNITALFMALLVMLVPMVAASHDVSQRNYDFRLDHKSDLKPVGNMKPVKPFGYSVRSDYKTDKASNVLVKKDYNSDAIGKPDWRSDESGRDRLTDRATDTVHNTKPIAAVVAEPVTDATDRVVDRATDKVSFSRTRDRVFAWFKKLWQ